MLIEKLASLLLVRILSPTAVVLAFPALKPLAPSSDDERQYLHPSLTKREDKPRLMPTGQSLAGSE
jgi:hypothetical protein